ncbi:MAG: hypothetical protein M1818_000683 [Claussenomyces sp. TS43310]|nr:MAG: hypothetical protein M1818_000683 [Claussenomyces sp. TS43310]
MKSPLSTSPEDESDRAWPETPTSATDELIDSLRQRSPPLSTARILSVPLLRHLPQEQRADAHAPKSFHNFSFSPSQRSVDTERHYSDASSCSAFTFATSSSASTDPWSTSGFVESEEIKMEDDNADASELATEAPEESEVLLEPKPESPENSMSLADVEMAETRPGDVAGSSVRIKRPRGRPRKHPGPSPESLAKVAKGRSKTGCITCRKRKKKCDEAKPRCMNCEKNAVLCEGYPERTVWKSGKEKAEEGTTTWTTELVVPETLMVSAVQIRRVSLPNIKLEAVIHGVETSGDRIFFEHYVFRLSAVLTVEGPTKTAFKDMLLPMAVKHLGLMHSILALSSTNIDYDAPYGKALLAKYPDVDERMLQERSDYHREEALKEFNLDISRQASGSEGNAILSARFGQMLCLVVQSMAEGKTTGEHRIHLQAYQRLIQESPPEDGPFLEFIREFFQYHIAADELVCLPQGPARLGAATDDWALPSPVMQSEAVRLLGVQDGLFFYMSKITSIRNTIRENMAQGNEPVVDYGSLYRAAEIDAGIRSWTPSWPAGDSRDLAGLLFKQMMWVYLWRTIYPPKATHWQPDGKITQAVNDGLALLDMFPTNDPSQTLLLPPTFIIGCAAFREEQRDPIRRSIATIRAYHNLKNADRALEVLEEVWRFMNERDERSWDWQSIAHNMGMDFLAT